MGHKCFISFKKEDEAYKKTIQSWVDKNKVDMIDKSLNTPIDSDDEDYIVSKIMKHAHNICQEVCTYEDANYSRKR